MQEIKKPLTVVIISDVCLVNSGVALQTRFLIDGLLKKYPGKYKFVQLGVAIDHPNMTPIKTDIWGEDCIIVPTKGYFNPGDYSQKLFLRSMLMQFKPDVLILFNDPRFFYGLWEMGDEVYGKVPVIYNHLWDAPPYPKYNKVFYESCQHIVCLNKQIYNWLKEDGFTNIDYITHALDYNIFKPNNDEMANINLKKKIFGDDKANHRVFFYNSRNARRKMTAHLIKCFYNFWKDLPKKDAILFLHSRPDDPEGANLEVLLNDLYPTLAQSGCVKFSINPIEPQTMAEFYNLADCTMNISMHEGFGLSCLESLASGTPSIATETGGLQDQIYDPETGKEWGVKLPVKENILTGAQVIPYIYETYYAEADVVAAMHKIYNTPRNEIKALGKEASEWVRKRFNMDYLIENWNRVLTENHLKFKASPYKFSLGEV